MHLREIRTSLWRWTAQHPAWHRGAEPESTDDWPPRVGSVAYRSGDALVIIDPLVPPGDEASFFEELDALIAPGEPVHVVTTIRFHRRSRDQVVARYRATTSRAKKSLPAGVETVPIRGAGEVMVWLPGAGALVPGDRLLGDNAGGLRVCPGSWLGYLGRDITLDRVREAMRPLLKLPVEMVLVSHGEPVLFGGNEAIAAAIDGRS